MVAYYCVCLIIFLIKQVYVSAYTLHACCLKYKKDLIKPDDKALIIGLSVAAGVLALVIVCFVIAISLMKRRKTKEVDQRLNKLTDNESIGGRVKWDEDYLTAIDAPSTLSVDAEVNLSAESNDVSLHRQPIIEEAHTSSTDDLKFEYEPNDAALSFDLTKLEFKESDFKMPRLNMYIHNQSQDDSFF